MRDTSTGLTTMQARYYDPVVGRFLATDPVQFAPDRPDMFNRYAYAANDPVNMIDPNGECSIDADGNEVGLCAEPGDTESAEFIEERLNDSDSLASELESSLVAAGERVSVSKLSSGNGRSSYDSETRTLIVGPEEAMMGPEGLSGATRMDVSAEEVFEHEGSHALDDVNGVDRSGTAEIRGGLSAPANEAAAVNRANDYRRAKGSPFIRKSYEKWDD